MSFGDTLRGLRLDAGMTQEDVANALGITGAAVALWESGKNRPRLDKLNQLARLLGVDASDLVDMREGVRGTSAMVPLVATAHMGEEELPEELEGEAEVPAGVAERHPRAYAVHGFGSCMNRRYPEDALLLIDPDRTPRNGEAVLADVGGMRLVRCYHRGASTLMLSPDSTEPWEDVVVGPNDEPVRILGVVVWYQSLRDVC